MKPFRMRVWDRDYNKMIPPANVWLALVFIESRSRAVPDAYLFDRKKKRWKRIPLSDVMQAIPAPDRDGNEMFEGDIVKVGGGRMGVVKILEGFSHLYKWAVSQPDVVSHPGSRVLIVGNEGRCPGPGLDKVVRERWQALCN